MIVSVKGIDLKADYSIRTFVNIVEYKKRYEPHNKISLTGYIQQATNEEYSLDTVVDILLPLCYQLQKDRCITFIDL